MVGGEGPGKASKVRKHQTARTPYERPRPAAGPAGAAIEPFDAFDAPGSAEKASLLGSVFSVASTPLRVARHLVNKVPGFGGYFGTSPRGSPLERRLSGTGTGQDAADHPQGNLEDGEAEAGPSRPQAQQGPNGNYRYHEEIEEEEEGPELSLNNLHANGPSKQVPPAATATTAQVVKAPVPRATEATGPTPYDGVLSMLRNGPLAGTTAGAPASAFPAPRTKEEREADAARRRAASAPVMQSNPAYGGEISSPVQGFVFGSPMPAPAVGSGQRRPEFGQKRYTASRLGPYGGVNGGGGAPGSALRPGTRPTSGYAFSRFAPQPAAAPTGLAGGSGDAAIGTGAGLSAAAAAKQTGGSPAPLAWTPMRATPGSAFRSSVGSKRKAENEHQPSAAGQPGSVSILDAQRRLRQRAETAAPASADRRSWRAGRTPYQARSAILGGGGAGLLARSGLGVGLGGAGATPARPTSASPAPSLGAFDGLTPIPPSTGGSGQSTPGTGGTGGSKPTTDTARRILETLNELEETIKGPSGDGTPGAGPSPPPTDSLGGGLPKPAAKAKGKTKAGGEGDLGAGRAQKRRVTFAELTGTPAPAEGKETEEKIEKVTKPAPPMFGKAEEKKKTDISTAAPALPLFDFKAASKATKPSEGTEQTTPTAPLFKFGGAKPSDTAAAAAAAALFAPAGTAPKAPADGKKVYSFGAKPKDAELIEKVKAAAAAAPPSSAPAPTFLFGKEKKEAAVKAPSPKVPVVKPAVLEKANRIAQEAAKSPLPAVDFSDEEEEDKTTIGKPTSAPFSAPSSGFSFGAVAAAEKEQEKKPQETAPAATGGWDLAFLQKNKETFAQATEAASKEVEESGEAAVTASAAPLFSFGAPAAATEGAAKAPLLFGAGASSGAAVPAFLAPPASGAAPLFSFGAAATTIPAEEKKESAPATTEAPAAVATTAPVTSSWGDAFLKSNQAAASAATEAAKKEVEGAAGNVTAPAPSGWGDAFLKSNQAAASAATEAAKKEAEGGADKPAGPTPTFSFGVPAATEPASTAPPTTPAFTFGAVPTTTQPSAAPDTAPAPASTPALGFSFGATPSQPTTAAATAAPPAFSFGAAPPANEPTKPEAPSTGLFGGPAASQAAPPAFNFGAPSTTAPTQEGPTSTAAPAFAFGASTGAASTAAPSFAFGAQPSSTGTAFSFGAGAPTGPTPTGGDSQATPAPAFSFGAGGTGAAANTAPTSSFAFGAGPSATSAPAGGFGFGASAAPSSNAAAPAPTFGFGAKPAEQPSAAQGGFGFGGGAPPGPAPMENNGGAGGFNFGASAAPAVGGFGAPAAPAFGAFGGPASTPAFGGFGGGQQAAAAPPAFGGGFGQPQAPTPAFGAPPPSQPSGFGAPQPAGGFGFGAPQPQQPAPFGAPQPAPGQMVPNPFGAAPAGGAGGGGFSIGTTGNSQSEGRRKVKVRRPGRK